jgi:hypothetical protein
VLIRNSNNILLQTYDLLCKRLRGSTISGYENGVNYVALNDSTASPSFKLGWLWLGRIRGRTSRQEDFVWKTSYEIDFMTLKFRRINDNNQKNSRTFSFFRQTEFLILSFLWPDRWTQLWSKHFADLWTKDVIEFCPALCSISDYNDIYDNPIYFPKGWVSALHQVQTRRSGASILHTQIPDYLETMRLLLYNGTMVKVLCYKSKVAGSIPDGVIGILSWYNPSDCTKPWGRLSP